MNRSTSLATALSLVSLFALAGCSGSTTEPAATELVSAADELATTGPTYAAGTVLQATDDLNLRSGAGTGYSVLRVMPSGSRVTVRTTSGANAWVAVSYNGYSGWAHTSYLKVVSTPSGGGSASPAPGSYSASRGATLARTALRRDGYPARGWCALETSNSVEQSGIVPRGVSWYRNNAIDMAEYFNANPGYLARWLQARRHVALLD